MPSVNGYPQFTTPPAENFDTETMRGSIQQIVADNIGIYVVCEFLMGTGANLVRKAPDDAYYKVRVVDFDYQ